MRRALLFVGSALVAGLGSAIPLAGPAAADCPEGTYAADFGQVCAGGPSVSGPPAPAYVPGNVSGSPGSPFLYVEGIPCNSLRWANCMGWIQNPSP